MIRARFISGRSEQHQDTARGRLASSLLRVPAWSAEKQWTRRRTESPKRFSLPKETKKKETGRAYRQDQTSLLLFPFFSAKTASCACRG
jgi:hypothetical protein